MLNLDLFRCGVRNDPTYNTQIVLFLAKNNAVQAAFTLARSDRVREVAQARAPK
jgi:hypothetical protein